MFVSVNIFPVVMKNTFDLSVISIRIMNSISIEDFMCDFPDITIFNFY